MECSSMLSIQGAFSFKEKTSYHLNTFKFLDIQPSHSLCTEMSGFLYPILVSIKINSQVGKTSASAVFNYFASRFESRSCLSTTVMAKKNR